MEEQDIAAKALRLFKRDQSHWQEIYEKASEDLVFLSDDKHAQWNEKDYQAREITGRPTITCDQTSQYVHQVANDIRQNTPTFTVIPDDDESSEEDAEAFRAIIRGIEYKSNADDVYDTAALNSIKASIGYIRVDHDYCDDEGFDQELLIKRVINPLSCFLDSESIECDGRDAKHGFIIDKMSVSEFKKKYPEKEVSSFEAEGIRTFKDDDYIQIAEYFEIVESSMDIAVDDMGNRFEFKPGMPFKNKRTIKSSKVMRYKLSGKDVLEETSFPGKYIPLIPVYGEEHWIEGKRHLFSLIRKAKGAQMMYNVMKSLEVEVLLKQPQAPVMVAEGSIEDYAEDWKDPSKSMALRYRTKDADGNEIPAPIRLAPPSLPTGMVNAARESVDDIKASMGLYNASIGQKSNETSGVAIKQRQQEGDVATFHFYDNLVRSITHVYRVLISAIPEIYDTQRVLRAIGKEDEPMKIGVNGQVADNEQTLDLSKGRYSVRVVPGASFTTKRQEAAAFYTEVVTKMPELMNVMGDLLFKYSDMAGADAMSERMKKVIDPKFLDEDEAPQIDPEKEQMKQIIEQGAQEIERLQAEQEQAAAKAEIDKKIAEFESVQSQLKSQYEKNQMAEKLMNERFEIQQKDLELREAKLALREKDILLSIMNERDNAPEQPNDNNGALAAAMAGIAQAMNNTAAPRSVVRDENGLITQVI